MDNYKQEVLFEDGDWRMVRIISPYNSPGYGRWIIIQHRCGGNNSRFSFGEWTFCVDTIKSCQECQTEEPAKIQGLHSLFMWNNEDDLL